MPDVIGFYASHKGNLARIPVAGFVTGIVPVFPKTGDACTFTGQLVAALAPVQPVAFTMFAGKLDAGQLSFIERGLTSLLKDPPGYFRDWDGIAAWARKLPSWMKI